MKCPNRNPVSVIPFENRRDLNQFIKMPWSIYRDYPKWIPPLIVEMQRKLDPTRNPFFEYGQVRLFGAFNRDGEMIGRIAAIHNPLHREIHHDSAGFFGLFESIKSLEVVQKLFRAAADYLAGFQCTHMIGPVNFSANEESGLLVEGYDQTPMLLCDYSPPYYADLLRACGCQKIMDLLSYEGKLDHVFPRKYLDVVAKASARPGVHIRPFRRRQLAREIDTIREIYNSGFKDVWGFAPLSSAEAEAMGRSFVSFSDDELVWIAEYRNQPVGLILALPDVNEILKDLHGRLLPFGILKFLLRRRRIRSVRVMVLCVLPKFRSMGIETLLIHKVHERFIAGGYQRAEFSVVNENNRRMRNILEAFGFRLVKRYRIYQVPISDLFHLPREGQPAACRNDRKEEARCEFS